MNLPIRAKPYRLVNSCKAFGSSSFLGARGVPLAGPSDVSSIKCLISPEQIENNGHSSANIFKIEVPKFERTFHLHDIPRCFMTRDYALDYAVV